MDTPSEEDDTNTSHDLGKYTIKNDGPIQGQIISEHAYVTQHFHNSPQEFGSLLPRFNNKAASHQEDISATSGYELQNASARRIVAMKPEGSNLRRPITVFLGYNEKNIEEIAILEGELKLRGIDITNIQKISPTKRDITHTITQEVDTLLIYLTRESLNSSFIWDTIIPVAQERYKSDHSFGIIAVLRGLSSAKVERICASRGLESLKDFYYDLLPDLQSDQINFNRKQRTIVNHILKTMLRVRLRQMEAINDHELRICLRTFEDRPTTLCPDLDLDLNWHDPLLGKDRFLLPTEWQGMLFPALFDVKRVLSELSISHQLHISLQSIIPVAFALGHTFRGTTSFTLLPWNKETEKEWSSAGPISISDPLRCTLDTNEGGDPHVVIVEIAISRSTAPAVSENLPHLGLSYKRHLQYEPLEGPHYRTAVKNASHALAMAHQIGTEFRKLYGEGITQIHLFAALPVALAVLIGHQFNAICPVSVYEYDAGIYKLACTLEV